MTVALPPEAAHETFRISDDAMRVRWPIFAGLSLSLLLHFLIALSWIELQPRELADAERLVQIELVPESALAPPPPAPVPEPPRVVPPPPPPPPPPAPTPDPPPPPPPSPPAAALPPPPPPQPVQRETATSAPRSSAPRPVQRAEAPPAPTPPATPRNPESRDGLLAPNAPPVERAVPKAGVSAGRARTEPAPSGPVGEKVSQSELDHLLAQVFRAWLIDYRAARFKDIVISGNFQLNPDGTLGAPFGIQDPWAPEKMIANYAELQRPELRDQRTALESFLGAMRQAQPFKRQPDAPPMTAPKVLSFSFRLGDL
jgi:hypothetical protein